MDVANEVIPTKDAEGKEVKFPFDSDFQKGVVTLALRDTAFMRRCAHLLFPSHFETIGEAGAVQIALRHFRKYGCAIDKPSLGVTVKEALDSKVIGATEKTPTLEAIKQAFTSDIPSAAPLEAKLAEFARQQAVSYAILNSVDKLQKEDFEGIRKTMQKALDVGANEDGEAYDYYAEIENRTKERKDEIAGVKPPRGITSGFERFDNLLYHHGWGRKELSVLMAKSKGGKSMACVNFAVNASKAGYNVLYCTLEVSARIIAERMDAYITDTQVRDLVDNTIDVANKVAARSLRSGKLKIHEFPSGSMKPSMLRSLIEKYRNRGVIFDLVIVDYADLMAPDYRNDNPIENSKEIYIGLRALASEFDCAMLTATQTNREGAKAQTATMTHVAEDFNKIRTADLVISINFTEDERNAGEARLYFAASRNQESGFTVRIKQDFKKMAFITDITGIE